MKKSFTIRIEAALLAVLCFISLVSCTSDTEADTETVEGDESITVSDEETTSLPLTTEEHSETEQTETTEPVLPEDEKDELGLTKQQRNSFSMLYYLAITAEEIRSSKNSRLILEDIYTDLLNDIDPGAIDEITQNHLENLRDIIKKYIDISIKRDRLQYIYNQDKAASIRNAVPNPLAVLSVTNSLNWRKLAITTVFTVVDSFNNYKNAGQAADRDFLMSGWELDDNETKAIQRNRERAFDYMVDMVQEYNLDGKLTLNEEAIETFVQICNIESVYQKIRRLESEQATYGLLGNYWLELADCYFETEQYSMCLDCIEKYNNLSTGIYRKDYNYVQILPKVIVAAQNKYSEDDYVVNVAKYADDIIENTNTEEWSVRYFAAQIYLDLYSRTDDKKYLESAYNIAYDNVTVLLDEQRSLNNIYISEVKQEKIDEPDYSFMTDDEAKQAKAQYKEEKKRIKDYNSELKKLRKTELPPLYEPLLLNCDLLFALAEKIDIDNSEKHEIEEVLQTQTNGVFLSAPVNKLYSFSSPEEDLHIELSKKEIIVPVKLMSENAKIIAEITDNDQITVCNDFVVEKVDRNDGAFEDFRAYVNSDIMSDFKWTENSEITVKIINTSEDEPVIFNFKVSEFKDNKIFGDKVVFTEE